MKTITLILSLPFLFLVSCGIAAFPSDPLYVVDLVNQVCAEYEIIDTVELNYRLKAELPLEVQGPCDRVAGWGRDGGFKNVQNWIRDRIRESK